MLVSGIKCRFYFLNSYALFKYSILNRLIKRKEAKPMNRKKTKEEKNTIYLNQENITFITDVYVTLSLRGLEREGRKTTMCPRKCFFNFYLQNVCIQSGTYHHYIYKVLKKCKVKYLCNLFY